MDTVREQAVRILLDNGMTNARAVVWGAEKAEIPVSAAAAMVEQESGGLNIYGHDWGGAFSTAEEGVVVQGKAYPKGSNVPVTGSNFCIFLFKICGGMNSNGVGPAQITYAGELADGRSGGYFRMMLERGLKPWQPHDNIQFGCELLAANWDRVHAWDVAFGHYNGGSKPNMSYGRQVRDRMKVWQSRGLR